MTVAALDIARIASDVLDGVDRHRQMPPLSVRAPLTATESRRVLAALRDKFEARGERILGRKVGFTNRSIWPEYGVYAPNWGYVTSRTLYDLKETPSLPAANFVEPKIEPEVMFALAAVPAPDMDDAALLDCIEWVSLGYEIVQSIFPQWKFTAPDSQAANAMHGALLVGERMPVKPRKAEWLNTLSRFSLALFCDGRLAARGGGAEVLEGPLSVLRHLSRLVADDEFNRPLSAGEIISTGTLTRALPVAAGETWSAKASGIDLPPIALRFS